jgi:inorganic pyrophosphatase
LNFFFDDVFLGNPNTLGYDGDELDVLLISDKKYKNWNDSKQYINCFIVGGLIMHDENGRDDKIFVVPLDEIDNYEKKPNPEIAVI